MDIPFQANNRTATHTNQNAPKTTQPTLTAPPPDHPLNETNYSCDQSLETQEPHFLSEDFGYDSTCSTPYVSAPSSPGRPGPGPATLSGIGGGFFYSCPPSPMHFSMSASTSSASFISSPPHEMIISGNGNNNEFEFSGGWSSASGQPGSSTMSSADELFLNGQIRPMKLSTHLERPQVLDPLLDPENGEEEDENNSQVATNKGNGERRGRDVRVWNLKSRSRRTRSMSPLRSSSLGFLDEEELEDDVKIESFCDGSGKGGNLGLDEAGVDKIADETNGTPSSVEGTTSRSSSAGRNSKRWVFLKDFLHRSKSEGRSNNKFWANISFSPGKERKSMSLGTNSEKVGSSLKEKGNDSINVGASSVKGNGGGKKLVNGGVVRKRRGPNVSPHELHYKASKAQAEEMRKRTFLPYRQGLLGCLGFSSKGYGAMNGFARALNPVSSG